MTAPRHKDDGPIFLGFDTGGTYTDAVLWREGEGTGHGIIASAKALTTRHDLSVGISEAAQKVLGASGVAPSSVRLVSMSTTLATNALVEGQGGRVGLVLAGFEEADLARDGLAEALGSDPRAVIAGGHDVHGKARPLDLAALDAWLDGPGRDVSAYAVAAMFAVRNPEHENAIRERIAGRTGLPVTCSHELSARLGGPRRALTTLLNARLVGLIDRLIGATGAFLESRGIDAPLMVVRGDGALVSAEFARRRPIETILSGPAASLVGARHLTGLDDAVVSDIGGTTTDVAILDGGRPRIDPEGATVGGWKTMVEAVAMRTFGLGGDSEVTLVADGLDIRFRLGPRRLVPLSLAGFAHGEAVRAVLRRQVETPPGRLDGRFAMSAGLPERLAAGLTASEAQLYARLTAVPQPLDALLTSTSQAATLDRLAARGLALVCGFTPSDAAHVAGRQDNWDADAARLGAALMARRKDGRGREIAASPEDLAAMVLKAVTRRSAEVILETALVEDGHDAVRVQSPIAQHALDHVSGIARFALSLDRPVIGLGASAGLHYSTLSDSLGTDVVVPADAGVANAVGAVVGQVRVAAVALVTRPADDRFRVSAGDAVRDFPSEADALAFARDEARALSLALAMEAGADDPHCAVAEEVSAPHVEGQRKFIEARIIATASGRARIAA